MLVDVTTSFARARTYGLKRAIKGRTSKHGRGKNRTRLKRPRLTLEDVLLYAPVHKPAARCLQASEANERQSLTLTTFHRCSIIVNTGRNLNCCVVHRRLHRAAGIEKAEPEDEQVERFYAPMSHVSDGPSLSSFLRSPVA